MIVAAGLALTGALALACFSKLWGALPRAPRGLRRHAASRGGVVCPQVVLAACCIGIGVAPALVLPATVARRGECCGSSGVRPCRLGVGRLHDGGGSDPGARGAAARWMTLGRRGAAPT